MLVRGLASLEGSKLRCLTLPGDVGIALVDDTARGDSGRLCECCAGEAGRIAKAGEADRAIRDAPATDGLADRDKLVRRATPGVGALEASDFACKLGPGTLLNRSSSWVLSFADRDPTNGHTFSPTSVYASLQEMSQR